MSLLSYNYRIGLDIQQNAIQAVLLKKTNKNYKLIALNSTDLDKNIFKENEIKNFEKLSENIKSLLQNGIPKPIDADIKAVCSIPETKILTHIFSLPKAVKEDEIQDALIFEVGKAIPYDINDLYFDFQLINEDSTTKKVLFACIPKKIADQFLNVLKSCNLRINTFALRSNAVSYAVQLKKLKENLTLILDFSSQTTNLTILEKNKIAVAEFIHMGLADFGNSEKKEEIIEKLIQEIEKIIKNFEKENKQKIIEAIICGTALENDEFSNLITSQFPLPIKFANPWKEITINLDTTERISKKPEISKKKAFSFVAAIGLAIHDFLPTKEKGTINLIPSLIKERELLKKLMTVTNIFCGLIIGLTLTAVFFLYIALGNLYFQSLRYEGNTASLERIQGSEKYQDLKNNLIKFNQEIIILNTIEKKLYSTPSTIEELLKFIPKKIIITKIDYNNKNSLISLAGIANKREDILELKNSLKTFPYFKSIESPLSNLDKKQNISFTIQLGIESRLLPLYGTNPEIKK